MHPVDGRLAEVDAALERSIHFHVEPGLDALGEELHGNRIHERTGNDRHQRKQQQYPHRETRAEGPFPVFAPERVDLPRNQRREQRCEHRVQSQQQRIVFREHRRIAARGCEQEKQHAGQRRAEENQQPHRDSASFGSRLSTGAGEAAGGRNVKRFHGDSRLSSRLVIALS